ncbi:MAG: serine/threonine-protein phosphatase [Spirochaetes bacterium]|jgi:serine phosphatase RsbU (regulator of sigma subunit)|nr:serine/threonine-protein phosphatase [Spirochaetota bacterium]
MMKRMPAGYDSRDADYFLREAISNLKGKIDFLYYGGLDGEDETGTIEFFEKLKVSTDTLYSMLNSNIIEKANKINQLHSILKSDLELAKKIQESILPEQKKIDGLDVCARFIPMSEVGGDIYDVTQIGPGLVRIFLADATGHGVQAALVTMIIKAEYEMLKKDIPGPSRVIESLSREFFHLYRNIGSFFTCIVADIDLNNKKIIYSSAGHPVQYLVSADGNIRSMPHTGKIIGVFDHMHFKEIEMPVDPKSQLYFFSDGIYEEFNESNEEYGEHRIRSLLGNCAGTPVSGVITRLLDDVTKFIGPGTLNDDITIIGVGIL